MNAPAAFADAVELDEFVRTRSDRLAEAGFRPAEALAVTASCRDELAAGLRAAVRRRWNFAFDFSSLSGLPLAGLTGIRAVIDHAPQSAGRTEVVIFAMPHIGVLADGTPGQVMRRGRRTPTSACGSLTGVAAWAQKQAATRTWPDLSIDPMDPEQSLVRSHLAQNVPDLPSLGPVALVSAVETLMVDHLWHLIEEVTDPDTSDVALVAGLLIHAPGEADFVRPGVLRVRHHGRISDLPGR